MNTLELLNTEYIRSSRTIETIYIKESEKTVYIYNYEGTHFRFFDDLTRLIHFFQFGTEPKYSFSDEDSLDEFLLGI